MTPDRDDVEQGHTLDSDAPAGTPGALFPVVGVGASAGGLAATTQLLRHLGSAPGIAVVVVHHLDPTRESSLVDILARVTSLPVQTAGDGALLEPNRVYVLPPNADLVLADGLLRVTRRSDAGGLHLPIDRFFESLATDRGLYAVGVLLSGTGSDGTQGIRAIKAEGGITFAQDSSAEYRGLPESAIATGCVDFVLSPEAIALELIRIGERTLPLSAALEDARAEADLQRILRTLRRSAGIDFASYKRTTVRRRVHRRVLVHGLTSLQEYADLVEASPDEAAALAEDVLIQVTSFFRDPEVFEVLRTAVFPKLLEHRPRDSALRVWVPGCSTGEEVYSIAISLLEFLADSAASEVPVKLFGTDVSPRAIEKARAARYPASIEQDVSPGRLQRFFSKQEGAYQIRKSVRDACVFAKHDATRDPPFSGMDLVSCRNLMIYLGPVLQDRLVPTLHYALRDPGFLVLGSSETVRAFPGFSVLDAKSKVYARSAAAPRILPPFGGPRPAEVTALSLGASPKPSGPLDVHREADRIVLAEFAPPGVVVTDDLAIVQFRGRTGQYLEPAPGVASFELLRMVKEELRLALRQTIDEARSKGSSARRKGLVIGEGPTARSIELEVIPFDVVSAAQRFFLVLFQEAPKKRGAEGEEQAVEAPAAPPESAHSQLSQELASTREYLQSVIEQLEASNEELKAANEEIVSSNEELLSTNEELQMAKEELEATNEELRTVNDEMSVRNVEARGLNDDLTNVLSSVEIPIVIVGRDSRIRRYTPAAARLLRLGGADVGRSVAGIGPMADDISPMIAEVLQDLSSVTRTARDERGRWCQITVRPYLSADNRIDGAVIVVFDIDESKKREEALERARIYAESVIDTVRESLVVLDAELRVLSTNRAFDQTFSLTRGEVEGRLLHELGRGEWNLPALRAQIEQLGEGAAFEGLRVEQEFERVGRRVFILNGRRIAHTPWVLLALDDVTERERAERAAARAETGLRDMLTTAAEAIIMSDSSGRVVFANTKANELFGFEADGLLGKSVDELVPEPLREQHAQRRADYLAHPAPERMGGGGSLFGRRKDGVEFPVEVVLGSMTREEGPLVVSFVTDITERQQSEQKLRDYQEKLQRMAFDAALAEERERRRIAADLHDRIGHALALAQIKLTDLRETSEGTKRAAIDEAVQLLAQSVADTRTVTFELSPPVLYDLGLKDALSWLVEDVQKRLGIRVELRDDGQEKLLEDAAAALVFRAVRELLMNVFKHAKSPSAELALRRVDDQFEVEVRDRGVGFDPASVDSKAASAGFGLFSMRERITRLGGTFAIESAPQQGTQVTIRVPLKPAEPPTTNATR